MLTGQGRASDVSVGDSVRTFYIHKGSAVLSNLRSSGGHIEERLLNAGEGFIATPGAIYSLDISDSDFVALQTSSPAKGDIYEIVDDGHSKQEVIIPGHRIITNPKFVSKPWGHELWISWLRDHHVLKQIGMTTDKKSSLQLHRDKLETNYLVEGIADVIDGYRMDVNLPEEAMKEIARKVDWDSYKTRKLPGDFWTNVPGVVHRVISASSYIAYETSTPELDDVIRLNDDANRASGRIAEEHLQKK